MATSQPHRDTVAHSGLNFLSEASLITAASKLVLKKMPLPIPSVLQGYEVGLIGAGSGGWGDGPQEEISGPAAWGASP